MISLKLQVCVKTLKIVCVCNSVLTEIQIIRQDCFCFRMVSVDLLCIVTGKEVFGFCA